MRCTPEAVGAYAREVRGYPTVGHTPCRANPKVLAFKNVLFGGLVNQLRLLAHALVIACHFRHSLVLDVWTDHFYFGSNLTIMRRVAHISRVPSFKTELFSNRARPWSDVVSYDRANRLLRSFRWCRATQIETPGCLDTAQSFVCPYRVSMFDDPTLEFLLPRLPLRNTVRHCRLPRDYHGIHLNLDVDWLTVDAHTLGDHSPYWDLIRFNATQLRAYSRACCAEGGALANRTRALVDHLARVVDWLPGPALPLYVATPLDKKRNTPLRWILERFLAAVRRPILTCACKSRQRELQAAFDLQILSGARALVVHRPSTFSHLACRRARLARNATCVYGFGNATKDLDYGPLVYPPMRRAA